MMPAKKHLTASSDHRTASRSNTTKQALSCKLRAIAAQKCGFASACCAHDGKSEEDIDGDFSGGSPVDHTSRMGDAVDLLY